MPDFGQAVDTSISILVLKKKKVSHATAGWRLTSKEKVA